MVHGRYIYRLKMGLQTNKHNSLGTHIASVGYLERYLEVSRPRFWEAKHPWALQEGVDVGDNIPEGSTGAKLGKRGEKGWVWKILVGTLPSVSCVSCTSLQAAQCVCVCKSSPIQNFRYERKRHSSQYLIVLDLSRIAKGKTFTECDAIAIYLNL